MNISAAKTSELVAFYNEHTPDAPVKKFATRAVAEARVQAVLDRLAATAPKRTLSEAIAASWENPVIAAKRSTRHAVLVNGSEHRSVLAAFRALRLPVAKHIPFRMALKEAGEKVFEHGAKRFAFQIVEAGE